MKSLANANLQESIKGQVITPEDSEYDKRRSVFYGGVDRRPAIIVRAADAKDVLQTIALARQSGLPFAVRSGGHSPAGHSVCEGGIVLDLSGMKKLQIDAERRVAWAETGLTAGEYTIAADAYSLATPIRRHRIGRHRRHHAERRGGVPGAQARADHRQSAGC